MAKIKSYLCNDASPQSKIFTSSYKHSDIQHLRTVLKKLTVMSNEDCIIVKLSDAGDIKLLIHCKTQ